MSESGLQWVVNAYALLFGGFLLLGGRAGDLIGRKRVFLAGLVALHVRLAPLRAGSTGETMLILARGLQGLGAALVSPAALSIVTTTFREGAERTKALGVWAAIAVGGGAVGLVLGGLLVETLSWPWIFFVNVPVGIAAFVVSLRYVPESKDEHAHKSFDLAGAVTVTGGLDRARLRHRALGGVRLGLGRGARLPRARGRAAGRLRADRAPLGRAARPPLDLLREDRSRRERRDVRRRGRALRDVLLQHALRAAGARLLARWRRASRSCRSPPGSSSAPGSRRSSSRRSARARCPLIGSTLGALGLLLFLRLTPDSSYVTDLLPGILLTSIGMGLVFVPITLIATSGVPVDDAGLASGLFNTAQQIGGALGLALLSTLATNRDRRTSSPRSAIGRPRPSRRRRSSAGST